MSVDYSVNIMYGVQVDITSSEYYNDIEPDWDTTKYKVELCQFGDRMGSGGIYVAFYQPSYRSFDQWSGDFGCWSFESLKEGLTEYAANEALKEATAELKLVGSPKWFLAHSVS